MRFSALSLLAALLTALGSAGSGAQAAHDLGDMLTIEKATAGFGGKLKAGFWQPVRMTIIAGPQGAAGRLEVIVPDGDQVPVVYRDRDRGQINLAAGQRQTLLLYAKSGPVDVPFAIRFTTAAGGQWTRDLPSLAPKLRSTQEFVVGVGPPIGLDDAVATIRRRAEAAIQAAQVSAPEMLPDRWWGYEGVDCLVLTTSDARFLAALSPEQRQAIIDWVQLGGRLVLSVGARGSEVASAASSWAPLIPGVFAEVDVLRERSGLESFTKVELPFDEPFFQRNRPAVTRLKDLSGEVMLEEVSSSAGRPLAIHATAGLGQVIFVGLDLDHPSLQDWKGRPRLVAALCSAAPVSTNTPSGKCIAASRNSATTT